MFDFTVAFSATSDGFFGGLRVNRFDHGVSQLNENSLVRIGGFANRSFAATQKPHSCGLKESTCLLDSEVFIDHLFEQIAFEF